MDHDNLSPPQRRQPGNERTPLVSTHNGAAKLPPSWLTQFFGNQRTAPPPGVAATSALNVETAAHQQRTVSFNAGPSHVLPSHLTSQVNSVNDKKVKHWKFCIILALFQCLLLGLFMKFVRYTYEIDAARDPENSLPLKNRTNDTLYPIYPLFQSNTLLIFFGISFLYFFMKKYGFTSAGYNFFISALGIEVSILLKGLLDILLLEEESSGFIEIDVRACLEAEFSAVTVPIALGCVLGKIGPLQLLLFSLIEIILYNLNVVLGQHYLHVSDAGGSVYLHAFACYYGVAACAVLYNPDQETSKNLGVSHTTDLFAIGGTLMLWCIWPSFNGGLLIGDQQHRAILNTFLSLVGSCIATFGTSSFLSLKGKFNMTHIQNATLAGGVGIGSCCNLMVNPGGALIIGTIAGVVCTLGMHAGTPFLARVFKVHDVSSVHNLHGLPAIVAIVASAFMVIWATGEDYKDSLYLIYPAMAPDSTKQLSKTAISLGVQAGKGWTRSFQAMIQLIGFLVTFVVAVAGGAFAGCLMKLKCFDEPPSRFLYTDEAFWEPKPGKVFVFDGSVTTQGPQSPHSVRRGTFSVPVPPEQFSFMWQQQQQERYVQDAGIAATPNLSYIDENIENVENVEAAQFDQRDHQQRVNSG